MMVGYVVGRSIELFYEDTGLIGSWDPEWIKQDVKVLIAVPTHIPPFQIDNGVPTEA